MFNNYNMVHLPRNTKDNIIMVQHFPRLRVKVSLTSPVRERREAIDQTKLLLRQPKSPRKVDLMC